MPRPRRHTGDRVAVKRYVSRTAEHDSRCSPCDQTILGTHGSRTQVEIDAVQWKYSAGEVSYEESLAHPEDTLDQIVDIGGDEKDWVHADCAEENGYEVIR